MATRTIVEELKVLQKELDDAEWLQDYERMHGLVLAIERLQLLQSYGEIYDVAW